VEILKDKYSITELSKSLKITDHALRYYEKEFNIKIPKDDRGRRFYSTAQANIMYQIKSMRDQGLEIKAIKKILESESIINESPSEIINENSQSLVKMENSNSTDIKQFFEDFKEQLIVSVATEVNSAKEHLSKEITKSKLELGACVENNARKLEFKMEKHFIEVDRSLAKWREKSKRSFFKNLFK
jgi:DNA-binding transcriptional MerR regulator